MTRLRTADHRKVEHALEQLEKRVAPQVRKRLELDAKPAPEPPGQQARRAAVLAQIGCQLLLGVPAGEQPYPSQALHPRAAALFRAKALKTPEFEALEQEIASDKTAGKRIFGADWDQVRVVFGGEPAPKKRRPIEQVDVAVWRRERWRAWLATDEGQSAVERGLVMPAASDVEAASAANAEEA